MSGELTDVESLEIVRRWCAGRGPGWAVLGELGRGGTATVFELESPKGLLAFKLYDLRYSEGDMGAIEEKRIDQQKEIGQHECPNVVQVYDGGRVEGRLHIVMNRAQGRELAKVLSDVPRDRIRPIVDSVARALIFLRDRGHCHRDVKAANICVSDDFNQVTLLDLSVTRVIHDPVGVGTDHDGQLPIVATARYSPPEYLFRLVPTGDELWHALNVYQLGCLLHDLIMRRELFSDEYAQSKENRYRFAWLVATVEPSIDAADVGADLRQLARRAIDKNWQRRSSLRLEDFLDDQERRRANTLRSIGIGSTTATPEASGESQDRQIATQQFRDIANAVKTGVAGALHDDGVTATHSFDSRLAAGTRTITWKWTIPSEDGTSSIELNYSAHLSLANVTDRFQIEISLAFSRKAEDSERSAQLGLPPVILSPVAEALVCQSITSALADVAGAALNASV